MARPPKDWTAILAAFARGDPVAVAEVTAVIIGWLAHYRAYEIRDSWEDLVHEVLERLIKAARRDAIREPSAFISYVGTTTRNVILDTHEADKKAQKIRDLIKELPPEVESGDPELIAALDEAIGRLPEELRVVAELKRQGYTNEEAAKQLDIELGAYRYRLRRAIEEIRKILGERG